MAHKNEYRFYGCPPGLTPGKRRQLLRALLHDKQRGLCYWCNRLTILPVDGQKKLNSNTATLDHVRPRTSGGPSNIHNLVVACYECNQKRGCRGGLPVKSMRLIKSRDESHEENAGESEIFHIDMVPLSEEGLEVYCRIRPAGSGPEDTDQ